MARVTSPFLVTTADAQRARLSMKQRAEIRTWLRDPKTRTEEREVLKARLAGESWLSIADGLSSGVARAKRLYSAPRLRSQGRLNKPRIIDRAQANERCREYLARSPEAAERQREYKRAYKRRIRGACLDCGGPTGYAGRPDSTGLNSRPSDRCRRCSAIRSGASRKRWTREAVAVAFQLWAAEHDGLAPRQTDWPRSDASHPHAQSVYRVFATWGEAVSFAGLQARESQRWVGRPRVPREQVARLVRQGLSRAEIAKLLGYSPSHVSTMARELGLPMRRLNTVDSRRIQELLATDLTHREIAVAVGCSATSVYRVARQVRERLRAGGRLVVRA